MQLARWLALPLTLAVALSASAQEGTFQSRSLTPETALVAARAALEACRKQGFQVAVPGRGRHAPGRVVCRHSVGAGRQPRLIQNVHEPRGEAAHVHPGPPGAGRGERVDRHQAAARNRCDGL